MSFTRLWCPLWSERASTCCRISSRSSGEVMSGRIERPCANCSAVVSTPRWRAAHRRGQFCSKQCRKAYATSAIALQARILEHSTVDAAGCWIWTGAIAKTGYGVAGFAPRTLPAHRVSYIAFKGDIPSGYHIDHLCRVKACVNPSHLEAVTPHINAIRAVSPVGTETGKTHCLRGHEFNGHNLLINAKDGRRICRACNRIRSEKHIGRTA